jgi:transcriptional regulator with XRE-family HTH domain
MNLRSRKRDVVDVANFHAQLADARLNAGDPSFSDIAKAAQLSKATVNRLLNDAKVPTWRTVAAYLRACDIAATEINTVWKPRWVALKKTTDAKKAPSSSLARTTVELATPAGETCTLCGTWVTDRTLHAAFHEAYQPRKAGRLVTVGEDSSAA